MWLRKQKGTQWHVAMLDMSLYATQVQCYMHETVYNLFSVYICVSVCVRARVGVDAGA